MSKKARFPQTPRHVLIYDEDWAYLESRFGPAGVKPVGVSTVVRALIHREVLAWREAENAATDAARMKERNDAHTADLDRPPGGPSRINI